MDEKQNPETTIIKVERNSFSFDEEFQKKYGTFKLKFTNSKGDMITGFNLNDLCFISLGSKIRKISDFEQEIINAGYAPLDIYQAQALHKQIENDIGFAYAFSRRANKKNIVFLGSTLVYADKDISGTHRDHYAFFEYKFLGGIIPKFICYEDDPCITEDECAIVFNKNVFRTKREKTTKEAEQESQNSNVAHVFTRFWEGELSQDSNPKKGSGKMPTLEQCQAKTIKLLREQNARLTKERDELREKYEGLKKISNPKLSTEIEELLITRVCDLGFSNRVIKVLDESDIAYVFQLIGHTKEQLNRLRKLGKNSIEEICQKLREKTLTTGITFRETEYNYFWDLIEKNKANK
ncbi:MAG: DNA-directed RNA polymerase subunit alpha C-terminal domain-containing protein [Patescibacteria group bacterium]